MTKDQIMKQNNLKRIRVSEGLTISNLSHLANVSSKVISQTERLLRDPTLVTKNKILKGLNSISGLDGKYTFEEVFPEDGFED
jgi:DNA-binding XRE family transcriptional regulator